MHYLDHSPPKSLQVGDIFVLDFDFTLVYQVRQYSSMRVDLYGMQAVPVYRAVPHINGELIVISRPFNFVNDALNVHQIKLENVRLLYNFINHKSEF